MKKVFRFVFSRAVILSLLLLAQLLLIWRAVVNLSENYIYFYLVSLIVGAICGILILNSKGNAAYKIAWLFPIIVLPLFGSVMYIIFGGHELAKYKRKKMLFLTDRAKELVQTYANTPLMLSNPDACRQSLYLHNYAYCPLYENTKTVFLPSGEKKFEVLLKELKQAKKYIFMEYFIIRSGQMWDEVLEILKEKAASGVDVRLVYDDYGCLMSLPAKYPREMAEYGIKCRVFNPIKPILSPRLNNRDHRKICVIDGLVGFTGGINFSDEYINKKKRFGYWKDTALMLHGEAVQSLSAMFINMWEYVSGERLKLEDYIPSDSGVHERTGYVQPYADNPVDDEPVGQNVYMNMINSARHYIWITTPYLIIDDEMITALTLASKSGVDVRIVTPGIPDKKLVYDVTRSNYTQLVEAGVKIYEYTPGFIHAKMFVCDDLYATVGTVNLDYRSLFLHFECGVWMYQTESIPDIKSDIEQTIAVSKPVTLEFCRENGRVKRLYYAVLHSLAPLL